MNTADVGKLAQLTTGADYWTTQAWPEIGIDSIRMADGPHGLRVQDDDHPDHLGLGRSLPATCFPPAATLAASWDIDLIEKVGAAIGLEARAQGVNVVLGPGLNLKRSPLCGRNFEYYSEDPLLSGRLAAAMVRGIQSNGVGACLKHFAANNQETDRMRISADVDEQTLRETYLRTFEIAIREGKPWVVMSAYNRINGVPASENPWLLTDVLRKEWGFDGLVVSDWGAVRDPAAAVRAGLDLRMPGAPYDRRVASAAEEGLLEASVLGVTAERLRRLSERTRAAGDRPDLPVEAHHALARQAAAESAVLLHNDGSLLPMATDSMTTIGVLGELARSPRFQGAGSSAVNPTRVVPALDALIARFGDRIAFQPGYRLTGITDPQLTEDAIDLARSSDLVLLFMGLPPVAEAEGADRDSIDIPRDQVALLRAVAEVNPRIVVALTNGSVVTTAPWRHLAGAIVEFWLPGQAHGEAIVDVLTGAVNPSGKLAESIPVRLEDTPAFLEFPGDNGRVRYAEGRYVGYRWYDARRMPVDYPFGHGLSYTEFHYSGLQVDTFGEEDARAVAVSLTLRNAGQVAGADVVQVYVSSRRPGMAGVLELRAFAKRHLPAGEQTRIILTINRSELEHYDHEVGWVFEGGSLTIAVGSSSRDIRLEATVEVPGTTVVRKLTLWSPFGEWLDHPVAGPLLQGMIDAGGGIKGRIGDLMSDPTGLASARGFPLLTVTQFPGAPFAEADAERILDRIQSEDDRRDRTAALSPA